MKKELVWEPLTCGSPEDAKVTTIQCEVEDSFTIDNGIYRVNPDYDHVAYHKRWLVGEIEDKPVTPFELVIHKDDGLLKDGKWVGEELMKLSIEQLEAIFEERE